MKRIIEDTGRRLLALIMKKTVLWLLACISPLLAPLVLFFFVYSLLFLIPRYIVQDLQASQGDSRGRAAAIFTTGGRDDWKPADDQALYKNYRELDRNWLEGFMDQETLDNSRVGHSEGNAAREEARVKEVWGRFYEKDSGLPAERAQVKQHSLSWALLAAVDRVLGDPVISGLPGRRPRPEDHFIYLEPKLKWREFELYYHRSWTEPSGDKGGSETRRRTMTYRHTIRLLAEVQSYEAERVIYQWEARRHRRSYPRADLVEEAVYPVLKGVRQQGPYFQRIRDLLADNGLVRKSDLELLLYLAMNYDQEFKFNLALISGNLAELYTDTENPSFIPAGPYGRYCWPTGGYRQVTSGYGWRLHPVLGGLRFHKGIDIAVPAGTPVLAAWDGRVALAGWVEGYGKTVIIDHGGRRTLYAHLMAFGVDPGREVSQGQIIGKADSSGLSTGHHLHFEIRSGTGETGYHDPLELFGGLPGEGDND